MVLAPNILRHSIYHQSSLMEYKSTDTILLQVSLYIALETLHIFRDTAYLHRALGTYPRKFVFCRSHDLEDIQHQK